MNFNLLSQRMHCACARATNAGVILNAWFSIREECFNGVYLYTDQNLKTKIETGMILNPFEFLVLGKKTSHDFWRDVSAILKYDSRSLIKVQEGLGSTYKPRTKSQYINLGYKLRLKYKIK